MTNLKVLVLGGTGPAGICLLRELLHRNYPVVAYARSPSKIPTDLASNSLLQIVKGEISDSEKLAAAVAQCTVVASLLGPDIKNPKIDPALYPNLYKQHVIPAMRQHGVKRILVMGTLSIKIPEDQWAAFHIMVTVFMRLFAGAIYQNMLGLADLFQNECQDLEWTIFRIAQIPGDSDEESWKRDREDGQLFTGYIGQKGWTSAMKRAALARWLVDAVQSGLPEWVNKMPAVSRLG